MNKIICINRYKKENIQSCDICNIDVHRPSYAKQLRNKKYLEGEKQNELIKPERLIKESIENKIKKILNPKALKQIGRENIRTDDKELKKELARKMNDPYYITTRALRVWFNITLESHHINLTNSKTFIITNYPEFGIEVRYTKKIWIEMASFYARLINQYKFKNQTFFSVRFDKENEDSQVLDETQLFISLNINRILTETDIDIIDIKSPLENQCQIQDLKDSGWRFGKSYSMTT